MVQDLTVFPHERGHYFEEWRVLSVSAGVAQELELALGGRGR